MLGYQEDDVAAKELSNVVSKVLNFGEVKANNFGRFINRLNSVAMLPHVKFLIT